MFGFIKKWFFIAVTFFSCNALKCVSMNNQECKIRPEILNINSNELSFYPYSIEINRVVVIIILMIHMLNYVFLMLLRT